MHQFLEMPVTPLQHVTLVKDEQGGVRTRQPGYPAVKRHRAYSSGRRKDFDVVRTEDKETSTVERPGAKPAARANIPHDMETPSEMADQHRVSVDRCELRTVRGPARHGLVNP